MKWRLDVSRDWSEPQYADVREYMQRLAPALMVRSMLATHTLLQATQKANAGMAGDGIRVRVPAATAATFATQIGLIEAVIEDETLRHGGVMVPIEGAPWSGRREAEIGGNGGNQRSMEEEFILWRQLFSTARMLRKEITAASSSDAGYVWLLDRRMSQLYGVFTCPALESWVPRNGFRYREVRACLTILNGAHLDERSYAALEASKTVAEARVMPLPGEVHLAITGNMPEFDNRNAARRSLNDPKRNVHMVAADVGQMSLFESLPAATQHPPMEEPERAPVPQGQMAMPF